MQCSVQWVRSQPGTTWHSLAQPQGADAATTRDVWHTWAQRDTTWHNLAQPPRPFRILHGPPISSREFRGDTAVWTRSRFREGRVCNANALCNALCNAGGPNGARHGTVWHGLHNRSKGRNALSTHKPCTANSLVCTCCLLGIEPWAYLKDVLQRISEGHDSAQLTPRLWKAARAQAAANRPASARRLRTRRAGSAPVGWNGPRPACTSLSSRPSSTHASSALDSRSSKTSTQQGTSGPSAASSIDAAINSLVAKPASPDETRLIQHNLDPSRRLVREWGRGRATGKEPETAALPATEGGVPSAGIHACR